jgi:hypothetical protein
MTRFEAAVMRETGDINTGEIVGADGGYGYL